MELSQLIFTGLMLVCMFVALYWLKPGKREAARYGMILVPYGGLLCLFHIAAQEMGIAGYYLRHHLLCSAVLLVFLLGVFMLRCHWKRVLLSCGVYALVHAPLYVLSILYINDFSVDLLLQLFSGAPGQILLTWFFVWLCARTLSAKQGLLTACSIEACQGLVSSNVLGYIPLLFGLDEMSTIVLGCYLNLIIWMLVFVLIMHYLHEKSWLRSVAISFILFLLAVFLSFIAAFILSGNAH